MFEKCAHLSRALFWHGKRKLDNLIDNISILLESSTISDIHQAFSILHVQNELQPKILEQLNFHSSF